MLEKENVTKSLYDFACRKALKIKVHSKVRFKACKMIQPTETLDNNPVLSPQNLHDRRRKDSLKLFLTSTLVSGHACVPFFSNPSK